MINNRRKNEGEIKDEKSNQEWNIQPHRCELDENEKERKKERKKERGKYEDGDERIIFNQGNITVDVWEG